ncbi:MAG: aminopeptidase P family protein [Pseudomonadota bacterium]
MQDLLERLRRSGYGGDERALSALLRGIAAAPVAHDPDAWQALIGIELDGADRAELSELVEGWRPTVAEGDHVERLGRLRDRLHEDGVDGFVLPRTDVFGSEYLPAADERVAWLTGFTGSAARVIVLPNRAAVFTDGRYRLQVEHEVDLDHFEMPHLVDEPPTTWLADAAGEGQRVGYDPRLHVLADVARLEKAIGRAGGTLVPLRANPVDAIWTDRPVSPIAPLRNQRPEHAGETSRAKRERMLTAVAAAGADGLLVSTSDGVAWLLNLRGGDIPFNPVCLGLALVLGDGRSVLLTDPRKVPPRFAFEDEAISVHAFADRVALYAELGREGAKVVVDPAITHVGFVDELREAGLCIVEIDDPVTPAKARKNAGEVAGARRAHRADGVALTRFLARLDSAADWDELTAVAALERERQRLDGYLGPSFDTISGVGPNGAVIHYRVSPATNRRFEKGTLYLVDSGGQFPDATTDVTRTVPIGVPEPAMRRRFTLVLKGLVALATARFPHGTTGSQLDALARRALWHAGFDYDHGTGHGVGSALCVHEGPQRVAKRSGDAKLEPGMIISNEPGSYVAGAYGIRIENLMLVVDEDRPEGGEIDLLGFETLTLVPIDRRLIDVALLSAEEIAWIDAYHASVRDALSPDLAADDAAWLVSMTAPLSG